MKTANLAGAVLGTILKVVFVVVVVYLVYTGASTCYDYGYRIFTEPAVSAGEGRKITVTLTSDMSAVQKRCCNQHHLHAAGTLRI